MFKIRLLQQAEDDLANLDGAVARRIASRLEWLADNFNQIRREPLAGHLTGLFKLRVGDYRVVYEPLGEEQVVIVHMIGHRRDVYRDR